MKNIKNIVFGTIVVVVMLISSCGQADFDVNLNIDDTSVPLAGIGSGIVIQAEIPVSSVNMGIDLEKLIYNYSLLSNVNLGNIEIKLSLYGESETDLKIRVIDGTFITNPTYLEPGYKNSVTENINNNWGWIPLINSGAISSNTSISSVTTISDNPILNKILKQDTIWIVANITNPSPIFGTLKIIDQIIQVGGSKTTGYYPGVF